MNCLLLFCETTDTKPLDWLATIGSVLVEGGSRWVVSNSRSFIALFDYVDFDREFDEDEGLQVLALIDFKKVWAVEWNDIQLLRQFMSQIPFDKRIVVCNDYGLVCDFSALLGVPIERWLTAAALPELPPLN